MIRTHMIATLIVGLVLAATAAAQDDDLPTLTSPDVVFDLGLHARSVALGAAGDIFNQDAMSVFQNPAALISRQRLSAVVTLRSQTLSASNYTFANADNDLTALALSYNIKNGWGAVGLGLLEFGVDDIPLLPEDGFTPTGVTFGDDQTGIVVSYAKPFDGDRVALGISYRYLRHENREGTGTGHGFDLGLRYRFSETWYGGVLVRDGIDMEYDTHDERGVSAIKYSLAGRLWGGRSAPLWLMISGTQQSKRPIYASVGLEQRFVIRNNGVLDGTYFFRGSLGSAYVEERNFGRHDGINAGEFGFGVGIAKHGLIPGGELVFDYAYRLGEVWDDSYFTLGIRLGGASDG